MTTSQSTALQPESEERLSFEQFLRRYDGEHVEWVDGKVIPIVPVSQSHDALVFFLRTLLTVYVGLHNLGKVLGEPFVVKVGKHGRSPDIIFVATDHFDRLKETHLTGAPDVAIEVISPGSDTRDRVTKFNEYRAAGVAEYWLLDPTFKEALFYRLVSDQTYQRVALDENGEFRSEAVRGFRLSVTLLWRSPLPDVQEAIDLANRMNSPASST